jgi:prolyl 4-hydroxylase
MKHHGCSQSHSLPHFAPSTVWTGREESLDHSVRKSEKAALPRDSIVKCIEERARAFQGWRPDVFIERLWSQRYGPGGHYRHHYDGGSGRISSFMVYLDANCTGGGTNFPRLTVPGDKAKWCEFVECDHVQGQPVSKVGHDVLEGVTFKPIKGNAIFWMNYAQDGRGYEESYHAALPVETGTKIGLNIWSWYQKGA